MELILLTHLKYVPSLVQVTTQGDRRRLGREAARELGWRLPTFYDCSEATLVLKVLEGMATVAFHLVPPGAFLGNNTNTALYGLAAQLGQSCTHFPPGVAKPGTADTGGLGMESKRTRLNTQVGKRIPFHQYLKTSLVLADKQKKKSRIAEYIMKGAKI